MNNQEHIEYIRQQVRKGLQLASENMLAFKRHKGTPVVIERNGKVVHVSPDEMLPASQSAV